MSDRIEIDHDFLREIDSIMNVSKDLCQTPLWKTFQQGNVEFCSICRSNEYIKLYGFRPPCCSLFGGRLCPADLFDGLPWFALTPLQHKIMCFLKLKRNLILCRCSSGHGFRSLIYILTHPHCSFSSSVVFICSNDDEKQEFLISRNTFYTNIGIPQLSSDAFGCQTIFDLDKCPEISDSILVFSDKISFLNLSKVNTCSSSYVVDVHSSIGNTFPSSASNYNKLQIIKGSYPCMIHVKDELKFSYNPSLFDSTLPITPSDELSTSFFTVPVCANDDEKRCLLLRSIHKLFLDTITNQNTKVPYCFIFTYSQRRNDEISSWMTKWSKNEFQQNVNILRFETLKDQTSCAIFQNESGRGQNLKTDVSVLNLNDYKDKDDIYIDGRMITPPSSSSFLESLLDLWQTNSDSETIQHERNIHFKIIVGTTDQFWKLRWFLPSSFTSFSIKDINMNIGTLIGVFSYDTSHVLVDNAFSGNSNIKQTKQINLSDFEKRFLLSGWGEGVKSLPFFNFLLPYEVIEARQIILFLERLNLKVPTALRRILFESELKQFYQKKNKKMSFCDYSISHLSDTNEQNNS